jgi:hypothetical protein
MTAGLRVTRGQYRVTGNGVCYSIDILLRARLSSPDTFGFIITEKVWFLKFYQPTYYPTNQPTNLPTSQQPTNNQPTNLPTNQPTNKQTYEPTNLPTN